VTTLKGCIDCRHIIAMSCDVPLGQIYEVVAVFSFFKILKILQDFSSHQIFGRMHGALNVGKKNN
jgi:hypothetical protein